MNNKSDILVVDDDNAHRTMLKTLLSGWQYNIIEADDGSTAIEKVKERPFDLVLMDIMMPEMDGYEAMQTIRKRHQSRKLPIIALTAKAMKGDRQKCLDAGANDYLSKPIDTDKLLALLRVWVS